MPIGRLFASTLSPSASRFWIATPRKEHQVGRFLGVFDLLLARETHLRRMVRARPRSGSRARLQESLMDFLRRRSRPGIGLPLAPRRLRRRFAGTSGLQRRPRAARRKSKAAPCGPFLGRTFDGAPQKGRDRIAETLWGEERLRSASVLPLGIALRARKNIARLSPKTASGSSSHTIPATKSPIVTPS